MIGGLDMEQGLPVFVETTFRILLGLRFLYSGVSNVIRWPHAAGTAGIVFPRATMFFGFLAVALMVLGGAGLALGLFTRAAALMVAIFLLPTFKIHWHWLETLPGTVEMVKASIRDAGARDGLQLLGRQAIHAHEVGLADNLILFISALLFFARGSIALGLDNLLG